MPHASELSVLVIDDDPIQLNLSELALETIGGCRVQTASEARPLVDDILAGRAEFDLVLMDIVMPEMDGVAACTALRRARIPQYIVAMTALDRHDDIDRAYAAGADDYIIKPFEPAELSARMEVVRRRKMSRGMDDLHSGTGSGEAPDIEGLVAFETLKSYVGTLDRGRSALSMVTCFLLEDEDSGPGHQIAVRECGRLIVRALSSTRHVVAYHGNGLFVCVTRLADPVLSSWLVDEMNAVLPEGSKVSMKRVRQNAGSSGSQSLDAVLSAALLAARAARPVEAKALHAPLPDLFWH